MQGEPEIINVISSNIDSFAYYEDGDLLVNFKKNPSSYVYFGVPRDVVDNVVGAESVGRAFIEQVRDVYDWRKI